MVGKKQLTDKRTEQLAAANLQLKQELAEHRRADEALKRLNRELHAISECNQVLVRAEDEQTLLNEICRIICDEAGFRLAWVGFAAEDAQKSIRPVARAGIDAGYLATAAISWADNAHGQGPSGIAVRTGKPALIRDFATDPEAAAWREEALKRGFRSSIALPLCDATGKVPGVLNIYSEITDGFREDDIRLLAKLAGDLTFGLQVIRARKHHAETEQELALQGFALNSVHEAAFLIDAEGRFRYVNDEACRVLKYRRDELLALSVAGVDPDLPMDRWSDHWSELRALKTLTFEGRHRTRDGIDLPVEINANFFEYKGAAYNLALVRNVAERHKAELERVEHLRYFEAMERINRAIQGTTDLEEMMRRALDEVLAIFACDRAYLLYPNQPESPFWSVPMERTGPEFPGLLASGIEMPINPAVAETFRILLTADHPVTFGPGGDFPVVAEVAERFGFKCFLATALYPKTDAPWQFGIQQCSYVRQWTEEELRLFKDIGRRIGDGLTGLLAYRDLLESEERLRRLNEELEERVEERTLELARSNEELQQAYDDLKTAQSRILQQEKMASIGQLAAGVAHEINNPMGFILSNLGTLTKYTGRLFEYQQAQERAIAQLTGAEAAQGDTLAELQKLKASLKIAAVQDDIPDLLEESIEGADRVKQIVQNLKGFARLDEDARKPADLNQCLDSTLNIVWNELKYKCAITKDYVELPPLLCNPGQLNQVFMNLLVNAGQAIETKGEIHISTRHEKDFVTVMIEDDGCGIPADKLSHIFEPFFTTKEVGKGTGLGLSIAYDIVKNHGGEISVESAVGRGSKFTIRLPLDLAGQ
jgi:PAS domain S-box-containing protein